ncbi:16S rRNA (cytosine(1402)-N(4))-methyltransferase RsmH [Pseudobdellovibrio exovorus]|uniref:Ribosomal RNA small subunit methyltransferase H n=1 Tax=Pseudobdellovibrio exovorus JSS TaxID=1184267 RepID=M4VAI9_9BACT|nr:16S rRNA (cytosine(1402)-N(4))-methyltransferase RsmH [Pseudobdellovibrio exovorus]AGH96248.1 S-adenosyl-methyltransferase [Pseudobdellovibrio exovorus JSS]
MSQLHKPVLLNEVVDSYSIFEERTDLIYFDGTFGRGGHFRAIQQKFSPELSYITDQDLAAIAQANTEWKNEIESGKVRVFHQNFYEFTQHSDASIQFDMVLLDLGVSSPQLDEADRGFSFNKDGPLDMRMNQQDTLNAAEIVNTYEPEDLIQIFHKYGEIQNPARVVRAIVNDRVEKPFTTTLQLAGLIERVDGWKKKGFHPATQYFMALRLVVNRELEVIENVLPLLMQKMRDKGRISVITFHSLEDRIVKNIFKDSEEGFLVNKKVIVPTEEECRMNVRARSAKLRIFQKGKPPEKPDKFALRRAQLNKPN